MRWKMRWIRNSRRILVRKPEEKILLGRSRLRFGDNNKMDLKIM
jgi:hypothetical protein